MTRRRQRTNDDDSGIVGDFFEIVIHASKESALAGAIISGSFVAIGAFLRWVMPGSLLGLGGMFGLGIMGMGLVLAMLTLFGWATKRGDDRDRDARFEATRTVEDLMAMDWRDFERLVADLYRRMGHRVREVGGSGDGGVDLIVERGDLEQLVQCKQYRTWSVGEPKVREFFGAMAAHRTRCAGVIVTCGDFTEPARRFADGKPLELVDGRMLLEMIREVNGLTPVDARGRDANAPSTPASIPRCPVCGASMVRRVAGRGPKAGQEFWGCSTFPRCKGIVPI